MIPKYIKLHNIPITLLARGFKSYKKVISTRKPESCSDYLILECEDNTFWPFPNKEIESITIEEYIDSLILDS